MKHDPARSCFRKKRYHTLAVAQEVQVAAASRGDECRIYSCNLCGGWHLTSVNAHKTHKPVVSFTIGSDWGMGYRFLDARTGVLIHFVGVPRLVEYGPERVLRALRRKPWFTEDHEWKFRELTRIEDANV